MAAEQKEKLIGKIIHYFANISVAIIELTDNLALNDKIRIKGATTDFEQAVKSMQMEHQEIQKAKTGQAIGLKVDDKVRENDEVYKI